MVPSSVVTKTFSELLFEGIASIPQNFYFDIGKNKFTFERAFSRGYAFC